MLNNRRVRLIYSHCKNQTSQEEFEEHISEHLTLTTGNRSEAWDLVKIGIPDTAEIHYHVVFATEATALLFKLSYLPLS